MSTICNRFIEGVDGKFFYVDNLKPFLECGQQPFLEGVDNLQPFYWGGVNRNFFLRVSTICYHFTGGVDGNFFLSVSTILQPFYCGCGRQIFLNGVDNL